MARFLIFAFGALISLQLPLAANACKIFSSKPRFRASKIADINFALAGAESLEEIIEIFKTRDIRAASGKTLGDTLKRIYDSSHERRLTTEEKKTIGIALNGIGFSGFDLYELSQIGGYMHRLRISSGSLRVVEAIDNRIGRTSVALIFNLPVSTLENIIRTYAIARIKNANVDMIVRYCHYLFSDYPRTRASFSTMMGFITAVARLGYEDQWIPAVVGSRILRIVEGAGKTGPGMIARAAWSMAVILRNAVNNSPTLKSLSV